MLTGLGLVFFYNVIDYMVLSYMPSYLSYDLGYGEVKGVLLILTRQEEAVWWKEET